MKMNRREAFSGVSMSFKARVFILLGAAFSGGCVVNPVPNAGQFHMSDAETKAAQYNAMQTKAMDRESIRQDQQLRKEALRDEAEVRAWESNITKPSTTNVIYSPRY
jgi:hypothetical protein